MKRIVLIILYWAFALVLIAVEISVLHELYLGAIWKAILAALSFALTYWGHSSFFRGAPQNKKAGSGGSHQPSLYLKDAEKKVEPPHKPPHKETVNSTEEVASKVHEKESTVEKQQAKGIEEMSLSIDKPDWSEEFSILFEYDPVVKEFHDELEGIDPQLSNQFREEVVSDRKNASKIRDRLVAVHEKKIRPYTSDELNEGLSEARLLGSEAEKEFVRVVEVMGEDADVDEILHRLNTKYAEQPKQEEEKYWGDW